VCKRNPSFAIFCPGIHLVQELRRANNNGMCLGYAFQDKWEVQYFFSIGDHILLLVYSNTFWIDVAAQLAASQEGSNSIEFFLPSCCGLGPSPLLLEPLLAYCTSLR
jgi:hypothetical protein